LASAASSVDRVSIRYVPPKNPMHQQIYHQLKQQRTLEKLQKFLSPLRLPGTLQISLAGCDGEPDAFYDNSAITGIVRLKFEGEAIPNSYFILVAQILQSSENQRTALPIQI
jgi:hypothetical protein